MNVRAECATNRRPTDEMRCDEWRENELNELTRVVCVKINAELTLKSKIYQWKKKLELSLFTNRKDFSFSFALTISQMKNYPTHVCEATKKKNNFCLKSNHFFHTFSLLFFANDMNFLCTQHSVSREKKDRKFRKRNIKLHQLNEFCGQVFIGVWEFANNNSNERNVQRHFICATSMVASVICKYFFLVICLRFFARNTSFNETSMHVPVPTFLSLSFSPLECKLSETYFQGATLSQRCKCPITEKENSGIFS